MFNNSHVSNKNVVLFSKLYEECNEYNSIALCNAAANILPHSAPGTKTKVAMRCAGFKNEDISSEMYRKCIERQKMKLNFTHPKSIEIQTISIAESESTLNGTSRSTLTVSSTSRCLSKDKIRKRCR